MKHAPALRLVETKRERHHWDEVSDCERVEFSSPKRRQRRASRAISFSLGMASTRDFSMAQTHRPHFSNPLTIHSTVLKGAGYPMRPHSHLQLWIDLFLFFSFFYLADLCVHWGTNEYQKWQPLGTCLCEPQRGESSTKFWDERDRRGELAVNKNVIHVIQSR